MRSIIKMADQVRRTFPSVIPTVSSAHMLLPSVDIYHWSLPSSTLYLRSPETRFKNALNGIFHMTLSPCCVFHGCEGLTERLCSPSTVTQRLYLKHALRSAVNGNTRHNKRPCCVCTCLCVCDEQPDRETRRWPLVSEPRGPDKAAQLCPTDAPNFPFLHSALYALWNLTL